MIRSIISKRVSAIAVIVIFSCTIVFHLLVLTGVVPYTIVWGSRLTSTEEMIRLEVFSLLINGIMVTVVLISAGYIRAKVNRSLLRFMLWAMALLFFLNTIGNIFSTNRLETIIFTPLTLLLAFLCIRLAVEVD